MNSLRLCWLNRSDMQQTAPDRFFGQFFAGIWHRDVDSTSEQQSHFWMADFVCIAAGEDDAKRLERTPVQTVLQGFDTHYLILATE